MNTGTWGQRLASQTIPGDPASPTLVFLHEGLGCMAMWKDFPRRLCEALACPGLLYDRLGYGLSPPDPRPRRLHYMHEEALDTLPSLLASTLSGRPYLLVGHSDGGSIALIHAAQQPTGLLGVVTEAAHVFVEPETLEGIEQAVDAYQHGKLDGLKRYHGEKTSEVFFSWADTWRASWFRSWDLRYLLPAITCPLLVLQGADDAYGTRRQVDEIIRCSAGPAQGSLLPGCGHNPHREQPTQVLEQIKAFVQTLLP